MGSDVPSITSEVISTQSFSNPKTKRKSENSADILEMAVTKITEPERTMDAFSAFGVVVANQLREMEKFQATVGQKLISDILYMGTLCMLKTSTQVVHINDSDGHSSHDYSGI